MRTIKKLSFSLNENLKTSLLLWAQQFDEVVWMDSNNYSQKHATYQAILAVDAFTAIKTDAHNAFDKLKDYQHSTADWIFGYMTYDLKNDVEKLNSNNFDGLGFPDLYYFQPKKIFLFTENSVEMHYLNMVADEIDNDFLTISEINQHSEEPVHQKNIKISIRTSKDNYLEKVEEVLEHIKRGDIYEVNICQEFYAEDAEINPLEAFIQLNRISKPPFSVFLKLNNIFALSASPERYLKKTGTTVISQPIKGTAKRLKNKKKDIEMAQQLAKDPKERSENIMITDLVRNDLSRIAEKGNSA